MATAVIPYKSARNTQACAVPKWGYWERMDRPGQTLVWTAIGSIAAVIGVIIALVALARPSGGSSATATAPASSASVVTTPPVVASPKSRASASASQSSAVPPSQPSVTYLSDMSDQTGNAVAEPVSIRGISYIYSIHYGDESVGQGLGRDVGERNVEFTYNLGGVRYRSFDAMLGFLNEPVDPAAVVQFSVMVDGTTVATESCSRFSACPIHARLPVGSQLTLVMQLTNWTDPSQKEYFPDAYPAWGDARLH